MRAVRAVEALRKVQQEAVAGLVAEEQVERELALEQQEEQIPAVAVAVEAILELQVEAAVAQEL
jgi:hypothetical protein